MTDEALKLNNRLSIFNSGW